MEFSQIAALVVTAGVFGIIAKLLKQPLIIGYIFAGIFLALLGFLGDPETFSGLGQVGVALLLFLLGLEMKISELPSIGKVALLTGLGQILFTSVIGFGLASALGFEALPAVYLAIALTFSSTIIMVKLLSEKNDLNSLYGKIAIGFLLVQDFVAILILMFLAGLGTGVASPGQYILVGIKALLLFVLVGVLSKKALPTIFEKIAGQSTELLFIASIAWALGVAALVQGPLGFTLEIGGFLAGLALSNLPEHLQIASRARPLRDFFLTIFFLLLGARLVVGNVIPLIPQATIFSLFVLIGNPIIVLVLMGLLGYRKRTSFMAGLTVAQISEFSLILLAMGATLGHVGNNEVALVVLVGVVTMTISTYLILGADKIYKRIKDYLSIFERKKTKEAAYIQEKDYRDHIVLVGADRTGRSLSKFFKAKNYEYLVVDFNPAVFNNLTADKIPVVFGDVNDPDIIEASNLDKANMVISTNGNLMDNLEVLEHIKSLKHKPLTIMTAQNKADAVKLYEANVGARVAKTIDTVSGIIISKDLYSKGTRFLKRTDKRGKSPEVYWRHRRYNVRRVLAKRHAPWRNKIIREDKLRVLITDSEERISSYINQNSKSDLEFFIHNDMSTANVFIPNPSSSSEGQVLFLDFEHAGATKNRALARLTDFNNFYARCWANPKMQRQFVTTYLRESEIEDIKYRYSLMNESIVFGTIFLSRFGMDVDHLEHDMVIALLSNLEPNLEALDNEYSLLKIKS